MLSTFPTELLHFFERFFAVPGGFTRRIALFAAKVGDNKFSFSHKY